MELEHWNEEKEGPLSEAAMRRKLEQRGYTVSRYLYPASKKLLILDQVSLIIRGPKITQKSS